MVFSTICCTFAPETSSFHLKMVFHSIRFNSAKAPRVLGGEPFLFCNFATLQLCNFSTFQYSELIIN